MGKRVLVLTAGALIAAITGFAAVASAWVPSGQTSDNRIPDNRIPDNRIPDNRIPDNRIPDNRIPNRYIVVLKSSVEHPGAVAEAQTESRGGELGLVYRSAIKGYSAELSKGAVQSLREDPRVKFVEPDRKVKTAAQTTPNGVKRIGAATNPALDIDETDDVRIDADVAVIDTGIDYTHPDLNVVSRTNCVPAGEDPYAEGGVEVCVDNSGIDSQGHGTHVAGTIAALDNGLGVVGAAPGARLWAVRVLNKEGWGATSWILAGIDWVTAHAGQIEVANMSLVGEGRSSSEEAAIKASVEAGVVYVAAAGNESLNAAGYAPANDPNVITVSALADSDGKAGGKGTSCSGKDDTLAQFSNWGADVELAAPGTCIYSTLPVAGSEIGSNYGTLSGTSMASPHVAGAAAVIAAKSNPDSKANVEAIRQTLIDEASIDWEENMGDGRFEPLLYLGAEPLKSLEVGTGGWSSDATAGTTAIGALNPHGQKAEYRFEYGPTTAYGSSTSMEVKEGKYAAVSRQLAGLDPGTTYHYRISATTSSGTVYGKDRTLKPSLWSRQALSGPPVSETQQLRDVSCPTSTMCIAVGTSYANEPPSSYLLTEGKWNYIAMPVPVGGSWPVIESVSCKSATSCIAVGKVQLASDEVVPLAESWDGSKWTIQSIPAPPTEATLGYARLQDISCVSTSECTAVGYFLASDFTPENPELNLWQTYVAQWQDGKWTNSFPLAVGESFIFMEGISCTSATFCASAAIEEMLTWNGTSWTSQSVPGSYYQGVSCTSQTFCLATSWEAGEAKTWNGTAWSTAQWDAGGKSLPAVSCLSPTDCVASGDDYLALNPSPIIGSGTIVLTPTIGAWNGNKVVSQATVRDAEEAGSFAAVDCNPSHTCFAVGTLLRETYKPVIASIPDRRPTATTEAPTNVGSSKTTLNGTVNPTGVATSYRFEWGTSTAYGSSIPASPKAIGAGTESVEVSETLTGLLPETTYHYRVVAENEGGTVKGEDRTFTTPPVAVTEPASNVSVNTATLNGKVEPSGAEISYQFEYGTTTSYGSKAPASAKSISAGVGYVSVSQAVEGLKALTTYHYRMVATNSQGTYFGKDATFTTGPPLHWFVCTKQAGGRYATNQCGSEGAPKEWESLKLKEAEKTTITAKGNPIAISGTINGINGTISCETEVTNASLENPSGGGNGVGNAEVKYKGCKAESGFASCTITPGGAVATKLALTTFEGKTQLWLTAKEGSTLASFTFSGCGPTEALKALNGTRNLTETMRGAYTNTASKVEFDSETTAEGLKLNNVKATAVGSIKLETTAGGYLKANDAPVAITEAASSVKSSEATLNGTVNPEGTATKYQFEYGKTTSYGTSIPVEAKSAGEGASDVKVTETPSGLVPATTYHYRLKATNGAATAYGVDMTFTTTAAPLRWFACTKQGGGKYTSATCATEGSPSEWESIALKEAEKTTITAKGNPIAITATINGIKGTLNCETEVTNASLENPSGGGNGIGNADVKYKGCKAESGFASCTITPGGAVATKLALTTFEGKAQLWLTAKEGTTLASFTFSGCGPTEALKALNGTRNLTETMRGAYTNTASKVEFSSESTAEGLKLSNQKATAVGSIGLETSAGGYVKAQ